MTDLDHTAGGSAKVPLVSEVLDRLLAQEGGVRARRSALFQAALQVCTDELRRVKKGATPAALETLVERARTVLTSPAGQMRVTPSQPSVTADMAPLLEDTADSLKVLATATSPEPPLAPPPAAQPRPAAVPPAAHGDPFVVAAEEAPPVPAAAEPWPPPPPPISFVELFPPPAEVVQEGRGKNVPESRLGARALLVAGALIVVGGAAAWYFYFRPLGSMQTAPTPAPAVAGVAEPTAIANAPAIQPAGSTPGAEPGVANAAAPTSAPAPTAWDLTAAPTAPPTLAPVVEPIAPAPTPTRPSQHEPARIASRPARPAASKAPASGQDRAAPMVSTDWAGRPPIYVVHFSSYHDRDKATADAARIAAEFRRPSYVAKVNLGAEGEWYRVVVGDFATADEAFAYRADLLTRHVPDVAHVYRLTAPK